ncbi:MAG: NUDIX domain-containing protein [Candidatus Hodarchaeales archaeon]|jgi:ADP-ribose pyrophosphatase YjhB (NUDIX family)
MVEDALQREIREETGIAVEIGQLHLVDRVIGRDQMGGTLYHFFFLTFDAQALNEDIHPQDPKTISAAWMKTFPKGMLLREDYELVLQRLKKTKFFGNK